MSEILSVEGVPQQDAVGGAVISAAFELNVPTQIMFSVDARVASASRASLGLTLDDLLAATSQRICVANMGNGSLPDGEIPQSARLGATLMLPAGKYRWTSAFTWPAGGYVNAPSQSGSAVAAAGAISLRTNSQTNLICRVSGVDGRRINAKALLATVNSGDMAVKVAVSDLITGTVLDTDWVRESALGYRIITTGALPFVLRAGHVFEVQLFASGNPRVWKGSVLDIEG